METELNQYEGHNVAGVKIDANRFVGRMKASQLFQVTLDPRRTEDARQLEGNTLLENVRRIRLEVQRLFEGAKRKNVESYARYMVKVHEGQDGMAPPVILYAEPALKVQEDRQTGAATLQIPYDLQLVAIDGETQLAARFEAANINAETRNEFVPFVLCHGRPLSWARQVFHDLNLLGVKPNAAVGLSMDERDPLTQVAREVAQEVPFFRNRVNMVRRQLRTSDKEVVTFTALRQACVTLAKGIGGVQFGARPVPMEAERIPDVRQGAIQWFTALSDLIGPAMENPRKNLASASSVMAALGAMGHPLTEIADSDERSRLCSRLIDKIRSVRWEKSKRWEGIAGKFTRKGTFSTSGAKDAAYSVYSALNDETSDGYLQIRANDFSELSMDPEVTTDIKTKGSVAVGV